MAKPVQVSEFTRHFGDYQMLAQREPVAVSKHRQIIGYFIAAEDYEAFQRVMGTRRTFAPSELSDEEAKAITA